MLSGSCMTVVFVLSHHLLCYITAVEEHESFISLVSNIKGPLKKSDKLNSGPRSEVGIGPCNANRLSLLLLFSLFPCALCLVSEVRQPYTGFKKECIGTRTKKCSVMTFLYSIDCVGTYGVRVN